MQPSLRLKNIEKGESAHEKGEKLVKNTETGAAQVDFMSIGQNGLIEALREIDITTLTPIEAMNKLYELQKMI